MGLPSFKNPLITKWSTIFNIIGNKSELDDVDILNMSESTGLTVSALYDMLGLTSYDTSDPDNIKKDNDETLANVRQFNNNGPILIRNPENTSKYIVNPNYNPGLEILFNGQELANGLGKMITKIDLSGTVTPTGEGNGLVKIQIGDNMNSSGWNTTDGKGSNATVADVATTKGRTPYVDSDANYSVGDWGTDVATQFTTSANISYTSKKTTNGKTDGYVHLNDGSNEWRIRVFGSDNTTLLSEATIEDYVTIDYSDNTLEAMQDILLNATSGTFYNPTTGKGCSTGAVLPGSVYVANSISSSVQSVMQLEANYPSAVGARIIRSFTINLDAIVPNGGRVMIVIELNGNVKTQTLFYLKGYTPNISTLYLYPSTSAFVYYSGIKYFGRGSEFTLKAPTDSITNLNNQLGLHSSVAMQSGKGGQKIIAIDDSKQDTTSISLFNDSIFTSGVATGVIGGDILLGSSTNWNNVCGFLKVFQLNNDKYVTKPNIGLTPANAFSLGNKKNSVFIPNESSTPSSDPMECLINTYSNASSDTEDAFHNETKRLSLVQLPNSEISFEAYNTSTSLIDNDGLQVIPGVGLVYPSKNYAINTRPLAVEANNTPQPNYSGCSGVRSFIRKFSRQGAYQVLTLTVTHNKHLHASSGTDYLVAGKIRFEFSMDGSTWYNISYAKPQNETTQGTSDSSFETGSTKFVFRAPSGFVNNFFYLRVKMTDNQGIIIKSITWTI